MAEIILSLEGVTKHFGGVTALKDVSFDVYKGEILGLMGPNGAGKTTLLNIIAGDFSPDSGTINWKGHNITGHVSYKSSKMGIARTYQIPQPFVTLSVLDNLRVSQVFGRKTGSTAPVQTEKILGLAGLLDKKDTLAGDLPILALKKLELARALSSDPDLLLMDEVAAGLTEPEIPKILDTIREVRNMGKTIILVEHVMKVMTNAVDRIIVLDKGMNLCQGSTNDVMCDIKVIEAYFGTDK
jgi:branched-chain amino acid transport system ATP-binding protein